MIEIHNKIFYGPYDGKPYKLLKLGYKVLVATNNDYLVINKDNKTVYWHRLVWEHFKGSIPDDLVVDHINENKLDNRIENLQLLTQGDNIRKHRNLKEPKHLRGVTKLKDCNSFRAHHNGFSLGNYKTAEEAFERVDNFLTKLENNSFTPEERHEALLKYHINPSKTTKTLLDLMKI